MIESIDPFLQGHSKEFVPNNPSGNHKLSRNAGLRTASDLQKKTITVNDDYNYKFCFIITQEANLYIQVGLLYKEAILSRTSLKFQIVFLKSQTIIVS